MDPAFRPHGAQDPLASTLGREASFGRSLRSAADRCIPAAIATGVAAAMLGIPLAYNYADMPGFSESYQMGRTKNSLAAVIAGAVAKEIGKQGDLQFTVSKLFWPNADLHGSFSSTNVSATTDVLFTSASFQADRNSEGQFAGQVKKSEYNWNVEENQEGQWKMSRFGPKWNTTLELTVQDGNISGVYKRPMAFDWQISGNYTPSGDVSISVSCPWQLDFGLQGQIGQR